MDNSNIVALAQKVKNAPASTSAEDINNLLKVLYSASNNLKESRTFHSIITLVFESLTSYTSYQSSISETKE